MSPRFSRSFSLLRAGALTLLALSLGACSLTHLPTNVEPEAPPSTSVAQAESRLAQARLERAAIEARFGAAEQVCYAKFFVNTCLEEAKEVRRGALAHQRAIELEAQYYVRKADADARDLELALSAKKFEAAEAALLAASTTTPAPGQAAAPAAKGARAQKPPSAPKVPTPPRPPKAPPTPAEQQAEAARRAANVAAYNARQAELAERQRRVADKVAKRAAKEAAKAK